KNHAPAIAGSGFRSDFSRRHDHPGRLVRTREVARGGRIMAAARIGFIGLGIMGKPMARNLIKAGFPVTVHNRSRGKVDELVKEGATPASSPREVASAVDIIITMLPNSPDVELVALGPNGLKEAVKSGQLFIDMSTINPIVSQKIAKELEPLGVAMVDAPVSGGEKGAIDAALSIMAGGKP